MTMRASTRERILKTAYGNPLGLLRLELLSDDEIRQAAASQPMDNCRTFALSKQLFALARRVHDLGVQIENAESHWNWVNRNQP